MTKRAAPPGNRVLEVYDLTKRFGARSALNGLSLAVSRGEIVGLVGSNGSGKTTSLRILAGLLEADGGIGSVLGFDIASDRERIRSHVGYLSQRYSLYGALTVKENLFFRAEVFGVADSRSAVSAVLDRFRLHARASWPAERLSGGWARMLQLAAAVVHSPQLVLLDEPTAGLDASARQGVWLQLTRLASEGTAIVLSTHDLVDASRCARIVFLSQGTVHVTGRPTDLVRASLGTVWAVFGSRVLDLVACLQSIPGVITSYPSGDSLRVVLGPGQEQALADAPALRGFVVQRVSPTLEDAVLGLAGSARG